MPEKKLIELFGSGPVLVARAPGRVNLIGDHTDYNGGYVLPAAVDCEIRIAFRGADDDCVEIFSMDFGERGGFELKRIEKGQGQGWIRYPMGVAWALQQAGHALRGMRAVVKGTIPIAAGLSSSAAFEVATAMAFCEISNLKIHREKLARICQRAENDFVGMKCGIMDQFACLLSRKGCALFIDCTTLESDLVPLDENQARIVVCDTRVKRQLVNSAYNQRRKECELAFRLIKRHVPEIRSYKDISVAMFKSYAHDIPEPAVKRARHVVTENGRVLHAVRALKKGDLISFGAAMDASHDSLRQDFEVSCEELDLLVKLAREVSGTYGSRMTGAGFGGCTVSLVRAEAVQEFERHVAGGYQAATGQPPGVYVFSTSDGATIERLG